MATLGNHNFDRWKEKDKVLWKTPNDVRNWMSLCQRETGLHQEVMDRKGMVAYMFKLASFTAYHGKLSTELREAEE